jgi:N-methylhydantoinase A
LRVGVDIGGTFTDAVHVDGVGRATVAKTRTTPDAIARGFLDALQVLGERAGTDPAAIAYLAHGTTIATNAIVQGRTARIALVTTEGFRDTLEIGTQLRAHLYDLRAPNPPPLVPRELRFEVPERVGPLGEVVRALDDADVAAVADEIRASGAEAIAVAFLFSFLNPAHEERAARILHDRTGLEVTRSSQVSPELREYPRSATTAINASLLPLVGGYVRDLAERLEAAGVRAPLHLMRSSGGVARAADAAALPVGLISSGPAAGVIGAARVAALAGVADALTIDVGGTTADVALVIGGEPQLRYRGSVAGHPVALPQVDVGSIGAGGGSIARVDRFGSLTVGPESAGADPGPAAYGMGGVEATVTDAHVVLGTLDPARFLGGRAPLDAGLAHAAVERSVAGPLGLSVEDAAAAVVRVLSANMAAALRVISVARGHDPRRFALVALGGAGPMHAPQVADELGIDRIVIPRWPGITAALGLLGADVRHDLARGFVPPAGAALAPALDAALAGLEAEVRPLVAGARSQLRWSLDVRYRGQAYELTVPLPARPATDATLARAMRGFHAAHRRAYGHSTPTAPTEIVTVRCRATIALPAPAITEAPGTARPVGSRTVHGVRHAVHDRVSLDERSSLAGPAIVEQEDSTVTVPRGWTLTGAPGGTLLLERG